MENITTDLKNTITQLHTQILNLGEMREQLLDKLENLRDEHAADPDSKILKQIQATKAEIEEIGEAARRLLLKKRSAIPEFWKAQRNEHAAAIDEALESHNAVRLELERVEAEFKLRKEELQQAMEQHMSRRNIAAAMHKQVPRQFEKEYAKHTFAADDIFLPALPWEWESAQAQLEALTKTVKEEEVQRVNRARGLGAGFTSSSIANGAGSIGYAQTPFINVKQAIVLDDKGNIVDLIAKVGN